jgi:hypothetical protein
VVGEASVLLQCTWFRRRMSTGRPGVLFRHGVGVAMMQLAAFEKNVFVLPRCSSHDCRIVSNTAWGFAHTTKGKHQI